MRKTGNTSLMLQEFLDGVKINSGQIIEYNAHELNLNYCNGCLRCNVIGRCSQIGDDWEKISHEILESDVIVFASPIYFHHVSSQLKKIIDRFRSFVHVQITEKGLKHTPRHIWNKNFVLILSLGSSSEDDAKPAIELFEFITKILGENNKLHVILATRLAVVKQIIKTPDELKELYIKMQLSEKLAVNDFIRNRATLNKCLHLGEKLGK